MRRLLQALVAVSAASAAAVLAAPLFSGRVSLSAGTSQFVNRPEPIDANNTPTLLRNPRLATNLVLTNRVDRPGFGAYVHASLDSGATWKRTALPLPDGLDRPFAPDAAFAPDGMLFFSYVNLQGNGNVPDSVWVATSRDGGLTISDPVRVAGSLAFQVRIAIDDDGRVHLTWLQAKSVGLLKLTDGPNPIVLSTSTDGGRTFSSPIPVSDPERERVGAATPITDGTGNLIVLYEDFRTDRRDFEFLDGPPWEEPFALIVTRSEDGGRTFTPGEVVDDGVLPGRRFLVFLPEFPSIAAGRGGTLFVAWADSRNGDEDVFLRRSDDGGRTWGPRRRVNNNPAGDGTSQYLPKVSVSSDGRVDVIYLDRRRDPLNVRTDASFASSDDQGRTFTHLRLTTAPFDSRVGPDVADVIGVDFGSRLAVISDDHGAVAAWTDSRLGTLDTGRQDIAAAAITVSEKADVEPGRLAAVVGLLALALAALILWRIRGAA